MTREEQLYGKLEELEDALLRYFAGQRFVPEMTKEQADLLLSDAAALAAARRGHKVENP
jgi:hypothetical protein